MPWRRLGLVFCPDGRTPWLRTHASNPVALPLGGTRVRVFFGGRDEENRSRIGSFDMDLGDPAKSVRLRETPLLEPGPRGAFDDSGVSMGCLRRDGSSVFLYYVGWTLGVTVPFRNTIGLAVSDGPDAPFRKVSLAPVLDRSAEDPYSLSYPFVLSTGFGLRMWYGTTLSWGPGFGDMRHAIRGATSDDGVHWVRDTALTLAPDRPGEDVVVRPWIARDADRWRMWFSARGDRYRLGYAESSDGFAWRRDDPAAGLAPAGSGWDGEEVAYPCVFDAGGRRWLLYNGNGYGRTGIGLAVLEGAGRA